VVVVIKASFCMPASIEACTDEAAVCSPLNAPEKPPDWPDDDEPVVAGLLALVLGCVPSEEVLSLKLFKNKLPKEERLRLLLPAFLNASQLWSKPYLCLRQTSCLQSLHRTLLVKKSVSLHPGTGHLKVAQMTTMSNQSPSSKAACKIGGRQHQQQIHVLLPSSMF
jgi:hypothetical protein